MTRSDPQLLLPLTSFFSSIVKSPSMPNISFRAASFLPVCNTGRVSSPTQDAEYEYECCCSHKYTDMHSHKRNNAWSSLYRGDRKNTSTHAHKHTRLQKSAQNALNTMYTAHKQPDVSTNAPKLRAVQPIKHTSSQSQTKFPRIFKDRLHANHSTARTQHTGHGSNRQDTICRHEGHKSCHRTQQNTVQSHGSHRHSATTASQKRQRGGPHTHLGTC